MFAREITPGVMWMGAVDWNRRLFDALIPLPDGTSYNAYLIRGAEKTALLDTVDPSMTDVLLEQLEQIDRIDYVIAHHAEQDHAGTLPAVLARYPDAVLLCSPRAKGMLVDHVAVPPDRIRTVEDGETLNLGDRTLQFLHMPWVHWPETMTTWLEKDRILFSCDLFGSHAATSDLVVGSDPFICEAAKRYFAEIMMPFRGLIQGHLKRIRDLGCTFIAPSHGPIFASPDVILSEYEEWVSDRVSNSVVIPYVTMHGSTEIMVDHLVAGLVDRGIKVHKFDLTATDVGKLAITLVDAATVVFASPTVHVGAHPTVAAAASLANMLRPKTRFAAIIGSYGWGTKIVDQLATLIPQVKAELLGSVLCKGLPRSDTLEKLDALATTIADRHKELG